VLVKNPRRLLTAGFGGVVATLFDVALLALMIKHGVAISVAAFFAAAAGAVMNFALNKYIAFRDHTPITLQQITRFGAVAVATAMLMALSMHVVAVKIGLHFLPAKAICAAIVFVIWTYPAQRRLVFARTYARQPAQPWSDVGHDAGHDAGASAA
jgi:putative flippase GtrA